MIFLVVAGGVGIAIYAVKHKTNDNTANLSEVLGVNTGTMQPTDTTAPPDTTGISNIPVQNPPTQVEITPAPTQTVPPKPVSPNTKTYLIPALALEITVPNSWYEYSSVSDASEILFTDSSGQSYYGSIEVFQNANETLAQVQFDLQNDPTVSNIQTGLYKGLPALTYYKQGLAVAVTAFVHAGNVFYLKGNVRAEATLNFK